MILLNWCNFHKVLVLRQCFENKSSSSDTLPAKQIPASEWEPQWFEEQEQWNKLLHGHSTNSTITARASIELSHSIMDAALSFDPQPLCTS